MIARKFLIALAAMVCLLGSQRSMAAVLMDFNLSDCTGFLAPLGDYYAGGTDCAGVQGPDYGVTFTSSAIIMAGDVSLLVFEQNNFIPTARLEVEGGFTDGIAFNIFPLDLWSPFAVRIGNEDGILLNAMIGPGFIEPADGSTTIGLAFDGVATWASFTTTGFDNISSLTDLALGTTTIVPIPAAGYLFAAACCLLCRRRARRA